MGLTKIIEITNIEEITKLVHQKYKIMKTSKMNLINSREM